jgi:1-aminocyclopropane-1-carboxylate deaminase/D-cysteine desulfhydrase-like pyridoxal-dependent ACC family enzyme
MRGGDEHYGNEWKGGVRMLNLESALESKSQMMITFGGAYSNHLVATAYSCHLAGLQSVGIVRGERPKKISHTLEACMKYGMELKFISRNDYDEDKVEFFQQNLQDEYNKFCLIPEGGYSLLGVKGAALISDTIEETSTHICCAIGTATTVAGLLIGGKEHQQIIGIPVLKGMNDIESRIAFLTGDKVTNARLSLFFDYHFGGYAKYSSELVSFMNQLYHDHELPSDFVYTAKMLFGTFDLIKKDHFPKGSKITCIHTGGLQGNLSLSPNTLIF